MTSPSSQTPVALDSSLLSLCMRGVGLPLYGLDLLEYLDLDKNLSELSPLELILLVTRTPCITLSGYTPYRFLCNHPVFY